MGHTIDNCPRDPNLKTNLNQDSRKYAEDELVRINNMKDFKKIFADTAITTTLLLKKCVKVPKYYVKSEFNPDGLPSTQFSKVIEQ